MATETKAQAQTQAIDEAKLQEFMGRAVGDLGAGFTAALVVIGDKLGLYKAMAESGALTPAQLAERTGTVERYVREWLDNQAASGYVAYDPPSGTYRLTAEQSLAFAQEGSPVFLPGAFHIIAAAFAAEPRISEKFRTGGGLEWGEHHACLFEGTERFFRPGYAANLVSSWLPSLGAGTVEKLRKGASVADIGCGLGASTILMAQAFPNSRFIGFDFHEGSITKARSRAKAAGVEDRVRFEVARSTDFPGSRYDLIAHFDSLHDMADPLGAARRVREALAPDGTWMIVEPFANDRAEDNHNPIGRIFYGASTVLCVPNSLAQKGAAMGAQAGEARLRTVVETAGFGSFRRATQTPFNLVFEAKRAA
jgi:2-polyprenyl-3-methyl-5-hydroxy-6-metoxy-1,4-benzoquinol methylase